MEDKKFNEYESLELIAKTIERARKTEIGRLNFITLYGILGLATYVFTQLMREPQWQLLWIVVAALSYGVPFVCHKMWRKQMTITKRVVKYGCGLFAFVGIIVPIMGYWDACLFVSPLMVIVGSCALFMLGGVFRHKAILIAGYYGLASGVMFIATNGGKYTSAPLFSYIFFAYCVYIGLSLSGKVDEIKTF